jgi:hypothetical protein
MSTEIRPALTSVSRKTVSVILFLCFVTGFTFGQKNVSFLTDSKYENEWWFPLIKKHNIDPSQFTFGSNIKPASSNPKGYTALELGKGAYINDTILTIKDPIFIIKENDEEYNIFIAEFATHDLRISQINYENGKMESFNYKTIEIKPINSISFDGLQFDTKTKMAIITRNVSDLIPK